MKVIVIGSGMVGIRFCEFLRKYVSKEVEIFIFGEENELPYDRVRLTSYFESYNKENLYLKQQNWYKENSIQLINKKVIKIFPEKKEILTEDNKIYSYNKLVIATGSYPFVPPIEGISVNDIAYSCFKNSNDIKNPIFVYRTIKDLMRIREQAKKSTKCLIVGGGLLGLEAAKASIDLGLETSIIELQKWLMPTQLDEEGGFLLTNQIRKLGIKLYLGTSIKKIEKKNKDLYIYTTDNNTIITDMVIFSVGIRPRDELAKNILATGDKGGIIVNEFLQTSNPDIYAIGEVALFNNKIYGLVAPGYQMAEVAAKHIAQFITPCDDVVKFKEPFISTKLKLIGIDVACFGNIHNTNSLIIKYKNESKNIYKKILINRDTNKIEGGIFIGDLSSYNILSQLAEQQAIFPEKSNYSIDEIESYIFPKSESIKPHFTLSENAIICKCNNVSKKDIINTIHQNSIKDLDTLKQHSNAGTGCGGCIGLMQEILDEELKKSGKKHKKILCEHFPYTRQELFDIIKVKGYKTFKEILFNYGNGIGCEICKPAIASILASLWNEPILKEETIQDTNDRYLANIQKGGTYSIVPRIPGGEITPDKLIILGQIAKEYNLYCKITGGQRIDLFGARLDDLPEIWEKLIQAGFESGHAYAKGLRTVKSCVGSTWCRYGVQDSTSLAIKLENRYKGLRAPHKIKAAVSGCIRECAEAQSKDFGIIATEKGWNLYVCGNGGAKPQHAVLLAQDLDEETLIQYLDRFLMFYIKTADKLTRTSTWFNQLEGGIDYLRSVIIDDSIGICEDLEKSIQESLKNYQCEWKVAVENPEIRKKFKTFINTDEPDPEIQFKIVRNQKVPINE
ncbi:MAG: nitrite reductase large subunit [Leptospiraceae bacterium]|nr:MAG: nitrite reductase large subunit [Leptospiraceae bacterium]